MNHFTPKTLEALYRGSERRRVEQAAQDTAPSGMPAGATETGNSTPLASPWDPEAREAALVEEVARLKAVNRTILNGCGLLWLMLIVSIAVGIAGWVR